MALDAARLPLGRVVLLGALSTFGPLSLDLYLPGLPQMATELSAPTWAAQLTMTACLIGLAAGQVVIGPLSDRFGRRRPLLAGLAAYAASSLLCAVAPSISTLLVLRLFQGLAGAAGIVIAMAIVRDLAGGTLGARLYAALLTVSSLAPVLAPLVGGQLLRFTDWRGAFGFLAAAGLALALCAAALLQETLHAERRHRGGLAATLRTFRVLIHDRAFFGVALCCALSFAGFAAYLGGSSFVLQAIHGLSPQVYSVVFAANAGGIIAASQLSRHLVSTVGSHALLVVGLAVGAAGGVGTLAATILDAPLGVLLLCFFLVVCAIGFVRPNAMALALDAHGDVAGSASGLFLLAQFTLGAAVLPLGGIAGRDVGLAMAIAMCAPAVAAPLALLYARSRAGERKGSSAFADAPGS